MCYRINQVILLTLLLLFVSACGNTNTQWKNNPDKLIGVSYSNYSPCTGKDSTKWNDCAGKIIKSQWKLGYDVLGMFNTYIDDELIAVYHNGIKKGPFESMLFYRGGNQGAGGFKTICNGFYNKNLKEGYETCTKTFYKEGRFNASRDRSKDPEVSKKFYIDGYVSVDPAIEKLAKQKRKMKERLRLEEEINEERLRKEEDNLREEEKIEFKKSFSDAKLECEDLGFKVGGDKFLECVLELTK